MYTKDGDDHNQEASNGSRKNDWKKRIISVLAVQLSFFKTKTTMYQTLVNSFLVSALILSWNTVQFVDNDLNLHQRTAASDRSRMLSEFNNEVVKLSLVILTYKKRKEFRHLLQSIIPQQTNFRYEIVIADNGCLPGLFHEIQNIFMTNGNIESGNHKSYFQNFKYLQFCDNPGYSIGNNRALEMTDSSSKYVLFLNDDLVMRDPYFLQSMVNLFEQQSATAGAVGCMLLNENGDQVLEAGSIVWSDGSTLGYGRDRTDIEADDLQYARPVDFASGACLMVDKQLFQDIDGFDAVSFAAYYEDTDLQMKIQHNYNRHIWLQPLAVALHKEHASFGTDSANLIRDSHVVFKRKWAHVLPVKHIYPGPLSDDPKMQAFRASDVRGRMNSIDKPNVLYIDEAIPFTINGNVRSFDNVMVLTGIGLRVTVFATNADPAFCIGLECGKRSLQQAGIEVQTVEAISLENLLLDRPFYYNVIIISGLSAMKAVNTTLHLPGVSEMVQHAAIIYDSPYLTFRRIEKIASKARELASGRFVPPGIKNYLESADINENVVTERDLEISSFIEADAVTAVSDVEKEVIMDLLPTEFNTSVANKVIVVGHTFTSGTKMTTNSPFEDRNGILFVGSFLKEKMFDNGDALWYFLSEIYPLILKEIRIPLTIVGRDVPQSLYSYVNNNLIFHDLVKFVESPRDLDTFYDRSRVFIAPHIYTSGLPYKVGEALSAGLPTVISSDTASNFGSSILNSVCIGSNPIAFRDCIITIHNETSTWTDYHVNGLSYSRQAYKQSDLKKSWKLAIETAIQRKIKSGSRMIQLDGFPSHGRESRLCQLLDQNYVSRYENVYEDIRDGRYKSGLDHFYNTNPNEGYVYNLKDEEMYINSHEDVQRLINEDTYKSGWEHFQRVGMKHSEYIYSPDDEVKYRTDYDDVAAAVDEGVFPSAWTHFINFGKEENRVYGCW